MGMAVTAGRNIARTPFYRRAIISRRKRVALENHPPRGCLQYFSWEMDGGSRNRDGPDEWRLGGGRGGCTFSRQRCVSCCQTGGGAYPFHYGGSCCSRSFLPSSIAISSPITSATLCRKQNPALIRLLLSCLIFLTPSPTNRTQPCTFFLALLWFVLRCVALLCRSEYSCRAPSPTIRTQPLLLQPFYALLCFADQNMPSRRPWVRV